MRALNIAATGMLAQQLNVEVISNNIANMNTTGFKRQRAEFQDLLYQQLERAGQSSGQGAIVPSGIQVGVGVKTGSVYRIGEQGNLVQTFNRYDLAVEGRGYFQTLLPSGQTAYSRAGNFGINADGVLVTDDGYAIQPQITIPAEAVDISVAKDGTVSAVIGGQSEPQVLGQIELAGFINPAGLEAIGDNLFLETPASGAATTGQPGSANFGTLAQGFLETANVNAVQEISALIVAQRAYEMNARVITTTDEMMSTASQLR